MSDGEENKKDSSWLLENFERVVSSDLSGVSKYLLVETMTHRGIAEKLQAARDLVRDNALYARREYYDPDRSLIRDKIEILRYFADDTRDVLYKLIDSLQDTTLKLGIVVEQCEEEIKALKENEENPDA